jgi:hypothetical protein
LPNASQAALCICKQWASSSSSVPVVLIVAPQTRDVLLLLRVVRLLLRDGLPALQRQNPSRRGVALPLAHVHR